MELLDGKKQYTIPIYQRTYSWKLKQCVQLLQDIIRVGSSENEKSHFVGSVVYFNPATSPVTSVPELLVIDGQQRLTTISLLLLAVINFLKKHDLSTLDDESWEEVLETYLVNKHRKDHTRFKLLLTRKDKETYTNLVNDMDIPEIHSAKVVENYKYFFGQLNPENIQSVYLGIKKLIIVDVILERDKDNPQLIFESLNSTGVDLTQADLIRNYILMGQPMDVKEEVSFFQAVKARLSKFDMTGAGRTDEDIETTIRQVVDKALVSEQVIDVFDAAGIKKPDISILSEDFLMELKGMEHKNVALEVLKKLLNDEIKSRSKKNLVKSKSLMEMLENSIKKYHNKILTAAEVMDELIKLSKDIVNMDSEAKQLGLSDFEYAFYTAVADNNSAKDLMEKDKLRELAVILTERVKANASIDWTIKESVRAKLKVIIKRTLRQFGYPPDMQKLATETVLKQAEMIAKELTND